MAAWDAWFPFYVGDYLAATQRLTAEKHGTYVLLILDSWTNGPPPTTPQRWPRSRGRLWKDG